VKDCDHINDAGHSDLRSDEPRANRIGTIEQCSMAESARSLAQTLGPQPTDTRVLPVARPPFAGPEEPFEGTEVHDEHAWLRLVPTDDMRRRHTKGRPIIPFAKKTGSVVTRSTFGWKASGRYRTTVVHRLLKGCGQHIKRLVVPQSEASRTGRACERGSLQSKAMLLAQA
jgi:hypothetical protein